MADVNLPSMTDLGQMEFMSPMAFQQGQKQIDLANLFQQQNLATGQEDLQTKRLANQFSEQANPLRINKLGMENEGLSSDNIIKGVEARTKAALQDDDIAAKRQKMLADMDEDKLKQFVNRASWEMNQVDDPKLQASGLKKIMASKAEFDRRNKQKDELEKIDLQGKNSKDVANIHAGATLGAARIAADSRSALAAAKAKIDPSSEAAIDAALNKMQSAKARHAALTDAATKFAMTDPDKAAYFQARADAVRPQAEAEINNRPAGIDVPAATGLPQAPRASIAAPSAPAAAPKNAPSNLADVSKMYPGVPAEKLREAYKKKFGVDLK